MHNSSIIDGPETPTIPFIVVGGRTPGDMIFRTEVDLFVFGARSMSISKSHARMKKAAKSI